MFILAFLLSINVVLLYKKINFYLHKFIYLIVIAFVFFILPSFINNMKQIEVLKHVKIYIPGIEDTFVGLIDSEQYFEKHTMYPVKKYNIYAQNTYNYMYVWIVFLFLLYC